MRIVIALGGNALLHRDEHPDAAVQQCNIDRVANALAPLAHDHELVLTHGNGPQIGLLAAESEADPALSGPYPLHLLGAQTQGMIGSLLACTLHDALPGRRIVTLVTHTRVRGGDAAFARPTKFVGQVYPREVAGVLAGLTAGILRGTPPGGGASSPRRLRNGSWRPTRCTSC